MCVCHLFSAEFWLWPALSSGQMSLTSGLISGRETSSCTLTSTFLRKTGSSVSTNTACRAENLTAVRYPSNTLSCSFSSSCCSDRLRPEDLRLSGIRLSGADRQQWARLSVVQERQQVQDPQRWVWSSADVPIITSQIWLLLAHLHLFLFPHLNRDWKL